jgi:hypothetical protein
VTGAAVRLRTTRQGDVTVLKVAGDLRLHESQTLIAVIAQALRRPGHVVLCDLTELNVPLMPSLLTAFSAVQRRCDPWPACSLLLAGADEQLDRALRAQRVHRYVPVLPTLDEGMAQAREEAAACRCHVELRPRLQSPRAARRLLESRWPAGRSGLDDAALVLHELAANAVRHVGADYRASWTISSERVVVGVSDPSRREPVVRPLGVTAAPGGRGMHIVDALSRSWGVRLRYREGKTVWAELP